MDLETNNNNTHEAVSFPYVYGSLSFLMGKKTS
jgi:hypothetical protein